MNEQYKELALQALDSLTSPVISENPLFRGQDLAAATKIKDRIRKQVEILRREVSEEQRSPGKIWRSIRNEIELAVEEFGIAPEMASRILLVISEIQRRVGAGIATDSLDENITEPQSIDQETTPIPAEAVSGPIIKGHPLHTALINQIIDTENEDFKKILRLMASRTEEEIVTPVTLVEAGIAENTPSANYLVGKLADSRPFYVTRGEKEEKTFRLHLCHTERPSEKEQIQIPENAIKDGPITPKHPLYDKLQEMLKYGTGSEREREILLFLSLKGPGEHSNSTEVAENTGCQNSNHAKVTIKGGLASSIPFYVAQVPIPGRNQQALFLCYREVTRGPIPKETVAGPITEGHPLHKEYQEFTAGLKEGQLKEIFEYAATLLDKRPFTYKELTEKTSIKQVPSAQRQCALMSSTRPFYFEIRKLANTQILYLCYQKTEKMILPDQGFIPPPEAPSATPLLKTSPQKAKEWLASVMDSESAAKIVHRLIATRAENESTTYGQIEKATGIPLITIQRTIESYLFDSAPFCLTKTKEGVTIILTITKNEQEGQEQNHQGLQIDHEDHLDWKIDQSLAGLVGAQDVIEYLALAPIGTKFPIEEVERVLDLKTLAVKEKRLNAILEALQKTKPIYIEIIGDSIITQKVPTPPKKPAVRHPEYKEWKEKLSQEARRAASALAILHPSAIMPLQQLLTAAEIQKEQVPRINAELANNFPLHLSITVDENGTSYYKLTESEYTLAFWLYSIKQHAKDPRIIRLAESLAKMVAEQRSFGIQVERVVIRKAMRGDSEQEISHEEINKFAAELGKFPPLILVTDPAHQRRFKFVCTRRKISTEAAARLAQLVKQKKVEEEETQPKITPTPATSTPTPARNTVENLTVKSTPTPPCRTEPPTPQPPERPNGKPLKMHKDFKSWRAPEQGLSGTRQMTMIQVLGEYPLGEELKLSKFARKIHNLGEDRYLLPLLRGLSRTSPLYVEILNKKGDTYIATRHREGV